MFWNKKRKAQESTQALKDATVEVIAHQNATKKEVQETKKVAQDLNRLLERNGITFILYTGMGGKHGR